MPGSCAAYGCTNRHKAGSGLHFFRFPLKNQHLLERWVNIIRHVGFTPTTASRLCSVHFNEDDYLKRPRALTPRLKPDAVPSKISGFQKKNQKDTKTRTTKVSTGQISISQACSSSQGVEILAVERVHEADALPERKTVEKWVQTVQAEMPTADTVEKWVQTVQAEIPSADTVLKLKKRIKVLQQRVRRQNLNISTLKSFLNGMKNRGLIEGEARDLLLNQFEGMPLELLKNEFANIKKQPHGRRYSQDIKRFAVTLHYHSPKAYEFCRTVLNLPHPSAISNVNAEPDFFNQVFAALEDAPLEDKDYAESLVLKPDDHDYCL